MTLVLLFSVLRPPCRAHGSAPDRAPERGVRRPRRGDPGSAHRVDPRPVRRRGAGAQVTPYLDGRPTATRPGSRFLIFGYRRDPRARRPDDPALLPPDRERRPVRGAEPGQARSHPGDPVVTRTDLRPDGQGPRQERPDLRGRRSARSTCREQRATRSCSRLSALLGIDPRRHQRRDRREPRSRTSISSGSPRTCRDATASLISPRPADALPGRPGRRRDAPPLPDGPLFSQVLGYTGPVSPTSSQKLQGGGLPARRPPWQDGSRGVLRGQLRGHLRQRDASSATPRAESSRCCDRSRTRDPGRLARPDHRHEGAAERPEGAPMGHEGRGPEARRRHRDEPADRRDPGDGQPADLRRQRVRAAASATRTTRSSSTNKNKPLVNHAVQAQYPPGSTYKLVAGTGALADGKITPVDPDPDPAVPAARRHEVLGVEPPGLGPVQHLCGFGHSSDTFFYQMAGDARHRPPRRTGPSSTASARRPGSTCPARSPGSSRPTPGSRTRSAQPIFPGETYQAGHRPGLRRRHADPADQRVRRAGERRQAVPAADRRARSSAPTARSSSRSSRSSSASSTCRRACLKTMREAARNVVLVRHTYNLVDLPIVIAGKSGTAEFGVRDSRAACRSTRGSSPSCRRTRPRRQRPDGLKAVARDGLEPRRPRLRVRLADEGQRRHRDREVLPPAPLRHQEGLPELRPPRARQLLPVELMSTIRPSARTPVDGRDPRRAGPDDRLGRRSIGAVWRAFDLQLAAYAALLATLGLVMAYTNSVERGPGGPRAAARRSCAA